MRKQQGQSAVEFALMAPLVFLMIFGMIWGGIMFMEYMHYANIVRTCVREIAVTNSEERIANSFLNTYKTKMKDQYPGPDMYEPTITFFNKEGNECNKIESTDTDVIVKVSFSMKASTYATLPYVLKKFDFPPQTINALEYRMKLE